MNFKSMRGLDMSLRWLDMNFKSMRGLEMNLKSLRELEINPSHGIGQL